MTQSPQLSRKLRTPDAVIIGLGSMMGAGLFAAFTPAAQAAGNALLVGLVVAAIVAFCNATSTAQLAASYPNAGGVYLYGRERLGEFWGFLAGWSFVIGKTASCAAMALTFAAYAAPTGWERPVAALAVAALAAVNYFGVTRTALVTRVIVALVLIALAIGVASAVSGADAPDPDFTLVGTGWHGILQSAGLLFFAFAGYARVATMGEEVVDPARTIPRAITIALALTVSVYGVVAVVLLGTLGAAGIAATPTPLADAAGAGGWAFAGPVVRVGAALAALGALLGLIAGIGRTGFAMAREGDLPRWLAAVHPKFHTPHRAEVAVAAVIVVLVLTIDLRGAIGFSSFGVLLYYSVANVAALTQPSAQRRYWRALQIVGLAGCLVLVATLPSPSIVVGVGVLVIGVGYRALARTQR